MTNVLVRDLDLNLHDHVDARRLEIVADGLPLFGGAQLAIDTTLVSAVRQDGTPRRGAMIRDGVALREARRRKERVYPELTGVGGRARWSSQARSEGVGRLKQPISCPLWPQPKSAPFHWFCKSARAWLGDGDGRVF